VFEPEECANDDDCDEGFSCEEQKVCQGGGCACSDCLCPQCPDEEDCPPCDCPEVIECDCDPEDYEETCEVTGAWCVPKEKACDQDSDCPEGWECAEFEVPCGCEPCMCPAIACAPESDCEEIEECDCPPCQCEDEVEGRCLPDGWSVYIQSGESPDGALPAIGSPASEQNIDDGTGKDASGQSDSIAKSSDCAASLLPARGEALFLLSCVLLATVLRRKTRPAAMIPDSEHS